MRYLITLCAIALLLTACDDKKSKKSRSRSSEPAETTATETPTPDETPSSSGQDTSEEVSTDKTDTSAGGDKSVPNPKGMPKPVPDNSLTVQEYMKLKVPDPSRIWQGSNYQTALTALKKIAEDDVSKLPRADSPRSGKLFARLVTTDNLKGLRNRDLALISRIDRAHSLWPPLRDLVNLYVGETNHGSQFDVEVVQLSLFTLDYLTAAVMMNNDIIASLPPDDEHVNPNHPDWQETNDARRDHLDRHLRQLEPGVSLRQPQRVVLAEGTLKRWPDLMSRCPENFQSEYRERVRKMLESEPNPKVIAALKEMVEYKPPEKKTE